MIVDVLFKNKLIFWGLSFVGICVCAYVCVYICVFVQEREREREREWFGLERICSDHYLYIDIETGEETTICKSSGILGLMYVLMVSRSVYSFNLWYFQIG